MPETAFLGALKNRCPLGLRPQTPLGERTALPLAGFTGLTPKAPTPKGREPLKLCTPKYSLEQALPFSSSCVVPPAIGTPVEFEECAGGSQTDRNRPMHSSIAR